ncbi:transglycosylase domain-containing protein [Herbaspirillum sp. SJZ107]|uniref:transglycosylase domain-containing protein n=1 Tax=Herbaspirillum sp. SJZ107 TaxID=2572881 RepID=UPI0011527CBF|nr:transglycosylase domain-containing protein [Herbaspirillum sp. SJZ107]TQK07759.1 transglycosylase [Herbaspirillum sp. SJZ107]
MKRFVRIALLFLLLVAAYLGLAAAWAACSYDSLAAALPPPRPGTLSPRQSAILLAVEDPDFHTHHGISFAAGQGVATLTAAVARDFYLRDGQAGAGLLQRLYAGVQRCCKAIDLGRDAMALVLDARMSKDRQLDYYIGHVYMGTQAGVQVRGLALAALLYAGKPLAALDEHEFVRLVAMIKAPNAYHPQRRPAALAERVVRIEALLAGRCRPAGWSDTPYEACPSSQGTP